MPVLRKKKVAEIRAPKAPPKGRSRRNENILEVLEDSQSQTESECTMVPVITIASSATLVETMCRQPSALDTTCTSNRSQNRELLGLLTPILEKVQASETGFDESLRKMDKCFNESDHQRFPEVLWRMMVVPFGVPKGNIKTDRMIEFFFKVVATIGNDYETLESNCLSFRILKLCVKHHREKRVAVRLRVVETIGKILSLPTTNTFLQSKHVSALAEALIERLKDKHYSVRAQSAYALGYLHVPPEKANLIRKISSELVYSLSYDPNYDVRKTALKSVMIDKTTIEYLVEKVNDLNDQVKISALQIIAEKIAIPTLTISQRESIIQSSIGNNSSAAVKREGVVVLYKWLELCGGNLCDLLHKLDVIENESLCLLVLNTLFTKASAENFEKIDKSFLVEKLIPIENINVERTFVWLFLFYKFIDDPYYKTKLMPDAVDMFSYIKTFLELPYDEDEAEKIQIVLQHMLFILKYIPLEEGSRYKMRETISMIFQSEYLSSIHIPILIQLLHIGMPGDKEEGLMNIISTILESSAAISDPVEVHRIDEDQLTELKLELASVMHQRHKCKRSQEEAISKHDFLHAQDCENEITSLVEKEEDIKRRLQKASQPEPNKLEENSEDEADEICVKYSKTAMCVAISALTSHLKIIQNVPIQVRHFYEHIVVKDMHNFEDPRLRKEALKLMTLVGLHNFDDAEKAMIFCLKGLMKDQSLVQYEALRCIFDLILNYSYEAFEASSKVLKVLSADDDADELPGDGNELSPLRLLTLGFLGSMDTYLLHVSVEGVIKLLLSNKLHAPRVVSTLLLIWANPTNFQTKIYKDVQRWLPIYADTGLTQGTIVANAFVPCINKILNAKSTSPLSTANTDKFMAFILQSTDQKKMHSENWAYKIHETIGLNVLEEMKEHVALGPNIIYSKILKQLDLSNCDKNSLDTMLKNSKRLRGWDSNRFVLRALEEFIEYLNKLLGITNSSDDSAELQTSNRRDASFNDDLLSLSDSSEEENQSQIANITHASKISSLTSERNRKNVTNPMDSDSETVACSDINESDEDDGDNTSDTLCGPTR